MIYVDGKKLAEKILAEVKREMGDRKLTLCAIAIGDIGNARNFLKLKQKAAENAGISFRIYELPENIGQEEAEKKIVEIRDGNCDGIIVELPLPNQLNSQKLLDLIPPEKDPDVLSSLAQKNFYNNKSKILPPSVEAVKAVFEEYKISLTDKKAAVFGQGILVGKPTAHWLKMQGTEVSIIDESTPDPEKISKNADIIISGVGKPGLVTGNMTKDGTIIIDFGFTRLRSHRKGQILGDVSSDALDKSFLATPVPGGIGPVVVASVLKNLKLISKDFN